MRINDKMYEMITMKCKFNPETGIANWTWIDPEFQIERYDLPRCWPKCSIEPPRIEQTNWNWTKMVQLT